MIGKCTPPGRRDALSHTSSRRRQVYTWACIVGSLSPSNLAEVAFARFHRTSNVHGGVSLVLSRSGGTVSLVAAVRALHKSVADARSRQTLAEGAPVSSAKCYHGRLDILPRRHAVDVVQIVKDLRVDAGSFSSCAAVAVRRDA